MKWQDYISSAPRVCRGKACIIDARVMATVIQDSLAEGWGIEEIIEINPSVSREAVQATLFYAAELAKEWVVPRGEYGSSVLFKLEENLPGAPVGIFAEAGNDAVTISEQKMTGAHSSCCRKTG